MRHIGPCLAVLGLAACTFSKTDDTADPSGAGGSGQGGATTTSSAPPDGATTSGEGTGGSGQIDLPTDDQFDEDSTGDDALPMTVTAPTELIPKDGSLVAITADDRLLYSTPDGLYTTKAVVGATTRKAASIAGNAYAKGRVVFNFAKVDYDTGTGALTFWTPPHGRRFGGTAVIGEASIAARRDDERILFLDAPTPTTASVVVASTDGAKAFHLLEGVGRGGMDTCGPSLGFAGDAAIVAWCHPGSMQATISRFTEDATGAWTRDDITDSAQGPWSSDAAGKRLFYVSSQVEGMVVDLVTKEQTKIGSGVAWGRLTEAGDAVFFTVGDQLRRSDMSASAIPIVVDGFQQAVAWSADDAKVLYSSQVVYTDSAKQDLRSSTTAYFNPSPATLVAGATATLGRSPMTSDGAFALFLTDLGATGGTLHAAPLGGGAGSTLEGVDTVVAAKGSLVVITDNRTPPDVFPPLVDMKLYDAATGAAPTLLEAGILDGRDILVRSDKAVVAYRRDGDSKGLWIRPL
ncbi:MAG: hypothetical protein U0414_03325 [Polyangiaceae bacterium]